MKRSMHACLIYIYIYQDLDVGRGRHLYERRETRLGRGGGGREETHCIEDPPTTGYPLQLSVLARYVSACQFQVCSAPADDKAGVGEGHDSGDWLSRRLPDGGDVPQ